jgi:hypothetical protein
MLEVPRLAAAARNERRERPQIDSALEYGLAGATIDQALGGATPRGQWTTTTSQTSRDRQTVDSAKC